ncbi:MULTISPECIES: hypothetical protein [Marinobacter]|uniref:hypothetical protein n=1 Tax=Marinobacter TaxID=2742 RepID=UPI000DABEA45|nr:MULTISPECIES: hypothetical protein [Marinobacter]
MQPFGQWFSARLIALSLGMSSLFLCQTLHAADSPLLAAIHQFRINTYSSLNAYYRYTVSNDTDTLNEIVGFINASNDDTQQITEQSGDRLDQQQLDRLTTDFDRYKDLMRQNINDVRANGYPDLRLVSDMANQAQALSDTSEQLYETVRTHADVTTDDRIEAARAAAVLMAKMMSKYSARSTSAVSQTFQGADTDTALDQQAKAFDELMSRVTSGNPSGDLRAALSSAASKWGFIRNSYINYNENNVSFIIDRYSKGILKELEMAISLLSGQTSSRTAQTAQTNTG